MRWVTYRKPAGTQDRAGLVEDSIIHALPEGTQLLDVLGDLGRAAEEARAAPAERVASDEVRLRAPIPLPPAVRDFYAFEQHVSTFRRSRGQEMDPVWYKIPTFYFTNPYAVIGPGEDVPVPPGCEELDFELEVAVVVGRAGSDLTPQEAAACIAGYCIMNDWSARDLQREEMRLMLGPAKGKDFRTTLGPFLVTPDELEGKRKGLAHDLAMSATVNGREYSRGNLSDISWSFAEMLAYASRGARIGVGDVIGSGTCGTGCIAELSLAHGSEQYPWLKPGDEVELTVEGLGSIRNRVVPGPPLRPLRE